MSCSTHNGLDSCACCEGVDEVTSPHNPPLQSSLSYRVGNHGDFVRRMVARLSAVEIPDGPNAGARPLAELTARSKDDPAIALLDAWACVGDVLTFYSERIANEGFMRTAVERRSVYELAREVGYQMSPGVAASTYLAFTISNQRDDNEIIPIDAGMAVKSVPRKKTERPQTFETVEYLGARRRFNAMRPRTVHPQKVTAEASSLRVSGVGYSFKIGQVVLIVADDDTRAIKRIADIDVNTTQDVTLLTFDDGSEAAAPVEVGALPEGSVELDPVAFNASSVATEILAKQWSEAQLRLFLEVHEWDEDALIAAVDEAQSAQGTSDQGDAYTFSQRVGFFGNNAPRWASLPASQRFGETIEETEDTWVYKAGPFTNDWDGIAADSTAAVIWGDSQVETYNNSAAASDASPHVWLERQVEAIADDSYLVVRCKVGGTLTEEVFRVVTAVDESLSDYALSAKASGLVLNKANGDGLGAAGARTQFPTRKAVAHVGSAALNLAAFVDEDALEEGATEIPLDRLVLGLEVGQAVVVAGERADAAGVEATEVAILAAITHIGGYTTLEVEEGLTYSYVRSTVTLSGNVAPATHGETVGREVLGSGDGSQANQRFALRKPPLTFVSSSSEPSGAASTVIIRVDGVAWDQIDDLFNAGPDERCFMLRQDNDGISWVIFGDGVRGARLPTGVENVTATYRSGLGQEGTLVAGQLTLPKSKPLGLKKVTNPRASTGAADPQSLDDARNQAPLGVRTLDRVVSLEDAEDFARTFAGIGKARAEALWYRGRRVCHVTIADAAGSSPASTDAVYISLAGAYDDFAEPDLNIRLGGYEPQYFDVEAKVLIDSDYESDEVLEAVETALKENFSFESQSIAHAVTAAQVLAAIHQVGGVLAVDLDELAYSASSGGGGSSTSRLTANTARVEGDELLPAEILLINEAGITLSEMEEGSTS